MEIKYLVVAYGGRYEDAWKRNLRAFSTEQAANALIANYEKWLTEARAMEYPESCAEHNAPDDDDTRGWEIFSEMQSEFEQQYLVELGIPEEDIEWIKENRRGSYDCDRPSYMIEEVEFSNT